MVPNEYMEFLVKVAALPGEPECKRRAIALIDRTITIMEKSFHLHEEDIPSQSLLADELQQYRSHQHDSA